MNDIFRYYSQLAPLLICATVLTIGVSFIPITSTDTAILAIFSSLLWFGAISLPILKFIWMKMK